MKPFSRRIFLVGAASALACHSSSPPPLRGRLVGRERMERGHRLRGPFQAPKQDPTDRADIVVVGGGVAGLSALWRLARGGFSGSVLLLELADTPGGTAMSGAGPLGPYPWGAHYITLPNREARHMHMMLADFGVVTGFSGDGSPRFDPRAFCLAPQERLFVAGQWQDGLWPDTVAGPDDVTQLTAFSAEVERYTAMVGADGKPAFSIPVVHCSEDPEIRALAGVSFARWLDDRGLSSPLLRWYLEYGCRDDYGTRLETTSAWAGLHYHCARRPWLAPEPDLGTHVLTWPAGNGFLVDQLLDKSPWKPVTGAMVRGVEVDDRAVRVHYELGGDVRTVVAQQAILAVPGRVADRLLPGLDRPTAPELAPWRVANLAIDHLPPSQGVQMAWDSVAFRGRGLGYVSNMHQTARYGGPTVLTWYEPLSHQAPSAGRRALAGAVWEDEVDMVLSDLAGSHPGLRGVLRNIDVLHWGHGTVCPAVGLHQGATLAERARPHGRVSFAHTDLSGLSLFEEASWHGIRAAEEVLSRSTSKPVESLL